MTAVDRTARPFGLAAGRGQAPAGDTRLAELARLDAPKSELVEALAEALGARGACPLDPAVPDDVWLAALVGPAAAFLARPGKDLRARLTRAGWRLAGGAPEAFPPGLARVIELIHAGSLIVDDVEDDAVDRRGGPALHHVVGTPLAINTGTWMYFWALAELGRLALPGALDRAVATLARCHQGQALDLATRVDWLTMRDVPAVVAATTRLKTGALCRFATELGALAAHAASGADGTHAIAQRAQIATFGERVGIALQMLDDLGSIVSRRDKAHEDLAHGRPTWPWAWLAEQNEPFVWARCTHELTDVMAGRGDADALARTLVERVGTVGRGKAREALDAAIALLGDGDDAAAIAAELRTLEARYG